MTAKRFAAHLSRCDRFYKTAASRHADCRNEISAEWGRASCVIKKSFTLVEIAIVLVIIGLLIGWVLKGQEMITNARISKVENDFKGISAAILSYQDRYGVLPGDDPAASTRFPGTWTAADNGNGNGTVQGGWNSTNNTQESRKVWKHLRGAGFIKGPVDATAGSYQQPAHAFGGLVGFEQGLYGISGHVVVFGAVTGDIAYRFQPTTADSARPTRPAASTIQGTLTRKRTSATHATNAIATAMAFAFPAAPSGQKAWRAKLTPRSAITPTTAAVIAASGAARAGCLRVASTNGAPARMNRNDGRKVKKVATMAPTSAAAASLPGPSMACCQPPRKPTKVTTRISGPGVVSPSARPSIICPAPSHWKRSTAASYT